MSNSRPSNQMDTNKVITIFGAVVIAVLLLGIIFVGYGILKQAGGPNNDTGTGVSTEEKLAAVEQMRDLYNSESVPTSAGGADAETRTIGEGESSIVPIGRIIFSGQIIGSPRVSHLFALDLGSGTTAPERLMPASPTSMMAEFADPSDPTKIFYLSEVTTNDFAIHATDLETGETDVFPDGRGQGIRSFEWSESGQMLAFNRMNKMPDSTVDLTELENWEIVILNAAGEQINAIDKARQPKWSPDGTKLLYFRVDGLYLMDLEDNSEVKIQDVGEGGRITGTTMMDLSANGTTLVWTTAKRGTISLFEITSWDEFEFNELGRIETADTEYYWPVISPEGAFYVVQAIDGFKFNEEQGIEIRENPRFEVRPIDSRTVAYSYPLDSFAFNLLFTDDWIASE